ncbi:unnamed protein product [Nyctereutes procyonoides]|uniref:(raccoon dog) hypothetical protein n=1 Tax=Nyctereutes procyonoides TaxID=34880 RepID=A0A811ZZG3_NYCPR|nr:unnamed protein product [Nyctereutes procyonoides]
MAASAKKKNKKGKTISLTDFPAEDGGTGGGSTYVPKPVSWADVTDDLEGDVSTTWHSNDNKVYRAPPADCSILPTAPWPKSPSYTAFLRNLPYDAEFEDPDSLLSALSLNEESLGNRRIRVDVADQAQDKDRDDHWRAHPAIDSLDDYPPRRDLYDSDRYRDGYQDGYQDGYRDGPRQDMDQSGYGSRIDSGRRAFGSGYRRDDDYRGGRDRFEDRYDRPDDWAWSSRDDYSRDDYRRNDREASVFGGAKPVDTAAREQEVEEGLQKEQEKLQRQLDEPNKTRSRTGGESSQTGTSATSGRNPRRRESEKCLENATSNKEEDCHSPTSKPPKSEQALKVMPAPPPKENAWVKQSSNPPAPSQSSDTEQLSPTSGGGKAVPAPVGTPAVVPPDGGNKDHWKEPDWKDVQFCKQVCCSLHYGEDENEGEDYTE